MHVYEANMMAKVCQQSPSLDYYFISIGVKLFSVCVCVWFECLRVWEYKSVVAAFNVYQRLPVTKLS